MSSRDEIEAVVRESYALRCAGRLDGLMAMFGPDPRFRIAGDVIPGELTKEVRGREELRALLERLIQDWNWNDYRIDTVLVEGNRAVAHGKGTMRYVPNTEDIETETLDVLTISEGKIVDFLEFCDTHMVARTLGAMPK
jgi:ketosteroid isomerase-like protein